MSKKQEFIKFIEEIMDAADIHEHNMPENVKLYWDAFRGANEDGEKPLFTDNGKLIMKYLQELPVGTPMMKAKEIAEGMFISSRAVSGAMRKLVTDGFVEKIGQDPVMYALTDAGRNIKI